MNEDLTLDYGLGLIYFIGSFPCFGHEIFCTQSFNDYLYNFLQEKNVTDLSSVGRAEDCSG